jgi:hypothetical protein
MTPRIGWKRHPLGALAVAVALGCGAGTAAQGAEVTRTLRQGLDGYSGVRDTWVSRLDWDNPPQHTVNYGRNPLLVLSRDGGDNPLVRFDVSAVPANSAVLSATLRLNNATASAGVARRVLAYRVLRDWDEGTEVASPINGAGKHGATGDHAFAYFAGEGSNAPWGVRGMQAGTDYDTTAVAAFDVSAPGWVSFDVTALVRAWVRGELPNHGVVLRDGSSYADDNPDWRNFASSQDADATLRPTLVVTYDPDAPRANAGPDLSRYDWDGSALTLDGSSDRPGGNSATLTYSWRVIAAGFGSKLTGTLVGSARAVAFTPDARGEWEIELTIRNDRGSTASDRVRLRLHSIPASHPRIYVTRATLPALANRARPDNPRWAAVLDEAADSDGSLIAKAMVGLVGGQSGACDQAVATALAHAADTDEWSSEAGEIALVYDWCHDRLSAGQKSQLVSYFNAWGGRNPHDDADWPGWGNYWPRWSYSYALVGLATFGDSPRASEWLDEYRWRRAGENDLPLLDRIADGGAWPEGMIYDWIANFSRTMALEAWRTGTGENLFEASRWFGERLGYFLLHRFPGTAEQWGFPFHPYPSIGDTERNRATIGNYERLMALILLARFPNDPVAPQLQAYLAAPPTGASMGFVSAEELLWFDANAASAPPALGTHLARGTGTLLVRSGWPTGAADTSASATHLTFQCGDHFTYHQHYDQGSFTLFKGADLLVDSGVYSGDGLSYHDQNYYVRTIAHNTLVVRNPDESFEGARPDAESNDGGQRPPYPASRAPRTIEYFDDHEAHYETGEITRFADTARFVFVAGDATAAYNNPSYNQAQDTSLAGNTAKVSRFVRELVYLRAAAGADDDAIAILDRVGVTESRFSGANTKLLFHTIGEPQVEGAGSTVSAGETLFAGAPTARANNGDAAVVLRFLQPASRNLRKVGGRGVKAFWVDGSNYDWHWSSAEPQPRPTNDFEDVPYGEWRLELEPADAALEHVFLTVAQPIRTSAQAATVTTVTGSGLTGAHIASATLPRIVLFSAASDGAAPAGTLIYSVPADRHVAHVLFDLTPGARYRLQVATSGVSTTVTLTPASNGELAVSDAGVLAFEVGDSLGRTRRHLR